MADIVDTQVVRRARRAELGAFLKSRRARISPEAMGLVPGPRRRTPGLRREEVAQLAGVRYRLHAPRMLVYGEGDDDVNFLYSCP